MAGSKNLLFWNLAVIVVLVLGSSWVVLQGGLIASTEDRSSLLPAIDAQAEVEDGRSAPIARIGGWTKAIVLRLRGVTCSPNFESAIARLPERADWIIETQLCPISVPIETSEASNDADEPATSEPAGWEEGHDRIVIVVTKRGLEAARLVQLMNDNGFFVNPIEVVAEVIMDDRSDRGSQDVLAITETLPDR